MEALLHWLHLLVLKVCRSGGFAHWLLVLLGHLQVVLVPVFVGVIAAELLLGRLRVVHKRELLAVDGLQSLTVGAVIAADLAGIWCEVLLKSVEGLSLVV